MLQIDVIYIQFFHTGMINETSVKEQKHHTRYSGYTVHCTVYSIHYTIHKDKEYEYNRIISGILTEGLFI